MRKYIEGKEIVLPAVIRFATNFISLKFVVEQKINMKRMFMGPDWMESKHSKTLESIEVVALVFNDDFLKDAEEIIVVMESLVRVLRMVDGDKLTIGYIYEVMDLTKEAIKRIYGDEEAKYMPLWDIIDAFWDRKLHSPLHAARYFLNPQYFYDKSKFNEAREEEGKTKGGHSKEKDKDELTAVPLTRDRKQHISKWINPGKGAEIPARNKKGKK
eukprot:PITA_33596